MNNDTDYNYTTTEDSFNTSETELHYHSHAPSSTAEEQKLHTAVVVLIYLGLGLVGCGILVVVIIMIRCTVVRKKKAKERLQRELEERDEAPSSAPRGSAPAIFYAYGAVPVPPTEATSMEEINQERKLSAKSQSVGSSERLNKRTGSGFRSSKEKIGSIEKIDASKSSSKIQIVSQDKIKNISNENI